MSADSLDLCVMRAVFYRAAVCVQLRQIPRASPGQATKSVAWRRLLRPLSLQGDHERWTPEGIWMIARFPSWPMVNG